MGYGLHIAIMVMMTLAGLCALPFFHLTVDSSRVLSQDRTHVWRAPEHREFEMITNYRFLRVLHVVEESPRFDSFVMGSSRVGVFDVSQLGDNWYKLAFARGLPYEHLHNLEVLLVKGVPVRHVMVGLDHMSFYRREHQESVALRLFPRDPLEYVDFLHAYLYKEPDSVDFGILNGEYELAETRTVVGYEQVRGSRPPEGEEELRKHDVALLALPPYSATLRQSPPRFGYTLDAVREMVKLSREHDLRLTVFINPFHYKNFLAMNVDEMEAYKRALVEITPFYDFSGLNHYTLDNRHWKEVSHYYSGVGAEMMRVMTGEPSEHEGFGVRVTEDSVEAHLRSLRARTRQHVDRLLARDPNIVLHDTHP